MAAKSMDIDSTADLDITPRPTGAKRTDRIVELILASLRSDGWPALAPAAA